MLVDFVFPDGFHPEAALQSAIPVLMVVAVMAAYSLVVFLFLRFVTARDMFRLDLSKNDAYRDAALWDLISIAWYSVKFVILFPIFAYLWFAVMALILVFVSENRHIPNILLIAMAIVSSIRIAAYYNERLAEELAKVLPFAVLGAFLVNSTSFDIDASLATILAMEQYADTIAYYVIFLVALEMALRFLYVIYRLLQPIWQTNRAKRRPADDPANKPNPNP